MSYHFQELADNLSQYRKAFQYYIGLISLDQFSVLLRKDDIKLFDSMTAAGFNWRSVHLFMAAKSGSHAIAGRLLDLGVPVTDEAIDIAVSEERHVIVRLLQDRNR